MSEDLGIEHFRSTAAPNIHLILEELGIDLSTAESDMRAIAEQLNWHVAILEGTTISDEASLLRTLGRLYQFPYGPDYSWDSANDWIGDLSWITGRPSDKNKVRGFLLLYLNPMSLFSRDPVEFAWFMELMHTAIAQHRKMDLPFHLVMGPLAYRATSFVGLLKVADSLCLQWHYKPEQ